MLERGELRDEVVATLVARRELPEGSDGHLAVWRSLRFAPSDVESW